MKMTRPGGNENNYGSWRLPSDGPELKTQNHSQMNRNLNEAMQTMRLKLLALSLTAFLLMAFSGGLFASVTIPSLFKVASSLTISQKPDTLHKSTAITDTSWGQAAKSMMQPKSGEKSSPVKSDTTGKPKPKKQAPTGYIDPYRPPILIEGLKKAQAGDLQGAILDFDSAVKKNPKNYNAYFYRAKAKIESGDAAGALEDINAAIKQRWDEPIYFYYRGKMLGDAGKSEEAIQDFSKAVSLKHDFTDAWNYRGVEYAKLGNHQQAVQDYDSAILYNPRYALCYYNKGTSLGALGKFAEASEAFSKSIDLDPKHSPSYLNRGNCKVQLKEYYSAISDYSKVIQLDPANSDAYYNRGAAHYLLGDNQMCHDWKSAAVMGNSSAKAMLEKYCK